MAEAIAHYSILDHIGTGGLGELYRARDTILGRTVALRVLPSSVVNEPARLEKIIRAARSAARLSHPNVAALFETGEDGTRHYLAFEYVPGELLSTKLRRRPLEVRTAVDFAIQLADALAEAEGHSLSHGDIRTDTIIITWKDRPKLLHFGLSEFTSGGSARRISTLSPAPAQTADRDGAVDDIRALGLVMYEMLTGRPPAALRTPTWSSPAAVNAEVPSEVDHVVRKALSANPRERYQTAVTVAAELRAVAAILDARTASASAALEARDDDAPRYRRPLLAVLLLTTLASLVFSLLRIRG